MSFQMIEQNWRDAQIQYQDGASRFGHYITVVLKKGGTKVEYVLNDLTKDERMERAALLENLLTKARAFTSARDKMEVISDDLKMN